MAFKLIFKGCILVWRNHIFLVVEFPSRKSFVLFDEYSGNSILGGVLRPLKWQAMCQAFGLWSRASKVSVSWI